MAARPPTAVLAGAVTLVIYTFLQGLKGTPSAKKGNKGAPSAFHGRMKLQRSPVPGVPNLWHPQHTFYQKEIHISSQWTSTSPLPNGGAGSAPTASHTPSFHTACRQIKHTGLSYLTQKVHLLILLGTLDFRGLSFVFLFVILRYQKNYFSLKCTNRKTNSANIVVISNAFSVQKTGAVGAMDSAQLMRALAKLSTCTSHTAASEVTIFSRKQLLHDIFIPCNRI